MENEGGLRREIAHLQVLAAMSTDAQVLGEIAKLIQELERRLRPSGNGGAIVLAPGSVWWPEPTPPAA
jgi:hypothetical protein